jgi:hypothetical protein
MRYREVTYALLKYNPGEVCVCLGYSATQKYENLQKDAYT